MFNKGSVLSIAENPALGDSISTSSTAGMYFAMFMVGEMMPLERALSSPEVSQSFS